MEWNINGSFTILLHKPEYCKHKIALMKTLLRVCESLNYERSLCLFHPQPLTPNTEHSKAL